MRVLSVGEVMVELAGAGPGLWRQGVAGDTFNTAWYLAALCPDWRVGYATRIGCDAMSDAVLDTIAAAGIETDAVRRDHDRSIGLYMITLKDGERSFTYWRSQSAARLLAEDAVWLRDTFDRADVIYLSGITLAILAPAARDRLMDALAGRRVAFDPNIRPRLWESPDAMQRTISRAAGLAEIILPSFDDEARAFGDTDPGATLARYAAAGAQDIVVKNGGNPVTLWSDGKTRVLPAPAHTVPVDTTGAGDSFNAGYLAARLSGTSPESAVLAGQDLASLVIRHPGALVPRAVLDSHLAKARG